MVFGELAFDGGGSCGDDGSMNHEQRIRKLEDAIPTLATKMDMAELRHQFADFRADVAGMRTDIHKAIAENARWTHTATKGMFIAYVLSAFGLLFTMYNANKQTPTREQAGAAGAPSAPPIIMNIPPPQALHPSASQAPAAASSASQPEP